MSALRLRSERTQPGRAWAGPLAALAALVASFLPASASAFCRATTCNEAKATCQKNAKGCVVEGNVVSWKSSTLEYHLHDRGTRTLIRGEARAAIRTAFNAWSDVLCPGNLRTRLRFVEGEDISIDQSATADPTDPTRKLNGVFFRDDGWPYAKGLDTKLASTFRIYGDRASPGTATSARIEVNTSDFAFALPDDAPGAPDLITVLTHEVGHFIGIGHSLEKDSIMMTGLCDTGNRCALGKRAERRLADDDLAAVCALYPPGPPEDLPEDAAPPSSGCATTPTGTGAHAWGATLSAIALLGLVVVRRQRHPKA